MKKEIEWRQKTGVKVASQKCSTRMGSIKIRKERESKILEQEEQREKRLEDLYNHGKEVIANTVIAERDLLRDISKLRKKFTAIRSGDQVIYEYKY